MPRGMFRFAENQPGEYFVFCSDSQSIVAAVDTGRLIRGGISKG
jgi:hypothetical protein